MEKPKPGSIVRINDGFKESTDLIGKIIGKEFVVVEQPSCTKDYEVWVQKGGAVVWFHIRNCDIVEESQDTKRSACNSGTDDFLKKQLHDNLRSMFT